MTKPAVEVPVGRAFAGADSDLANRTGIRTGVSPSISQVDCGLISQRAAGEVLIDEAVRDERPSVGAVSICNPSVGWDMPTSIERVSCLYGPFIPTCLVTLPVLPPSLPLMVLSIRVVRPL